MDSRGRKKQKDAAPPVKVELPHLTEPRGDHILHEKEYNIRDMAYRQSPRERLQTKDIQIKG